LHLYALVELLIGVSALAVPRELAFGRAFLERLDAGHPLSLSLYDILAGLWIGITLVPWCACMGATFPFAMAAIRESGSAASPRSFSYLYLANVLRAVAGAAIPLLLIERRGFQGTLHVGAVLNLCLATSAFLLPLRQGKVADRKTASATSTSPTAPTNRWPYYLLFGTGLTSMAAEVVWIRLFTPSLGTMVYAFAMILGLYLGATYLGSQFYRRLKSTQQGVTGLLFALLALSVVLPLLICDPRLPIFYYFRVLSILPFSFIVGWITPMVLDGVAQGDPDRAGVGYAINIAGCVFGPLVSGFVPPITGGTLHSAGLCASLDRSQSPPAFRYRSSCRHTQAPSMWKPVLVSSIALVLVAVTNDYETRFSRARCAATAQPQSRP